MNRAGKWPFKMNFEWNDKTDLLKPLKKISEMQLGEVNQHNTSVYAES